MHTAYDYIIVGASPSGCVLANRLSANPSHTVLLLESGPDDQNQLVSMPMGLGKLLVPGSRYIWEYQVSPGGNRPPQPWVKGKTLGGGSSVNGMVYTRGRPEDYDSWERGGCSGWGWDQMGPSFTAIEDHALGAKEGRGAGGLLHVGMPPRREKLSRASIEAAREAGVQTVDDINDLDSVQHGGYGWQPRTIKGGQRFSASRAFLKPARGRPNLHILCEADVQSVLIQNRRAIGVKFQHQGQEKSLSATQEVFLCAGALHSPLLLQRSGIGAADLLQRLGIDVVQDAPQVGQNLQDHRSIPMMFTARSGGSNGGLHGLGLVKSVLHYMFLRGGPLGQSTFATGGFVKTSPELTAPDAQIGFGPFSAGATGINKHPGFTLFGYTLRPESRGQIALASRDPTAAPHIDINYFATENDRAGAVAVMRFMRHMAQQPALQQHIVSEDVPGPHCLSDDELLEAAFDYGTTGYHVAGTCRMGSDDQAVLDPQLRVRGVDGLRVVDTSIMPNLVSANTNAPAMAIAWRLADMMLKS